MIFRAKVNAGSILLIQGNSPQSEKHPTFGCKSLLIQRLMVFLGSLWIYSKGKWRLGPESQRRPTLLFLLYLIEPFSSTYPQSYPQYSSVRQPALNPAVGVVLRLQALKESYYCSTISFPSPVTVRNCPTLYDTWFKYRPSEFWA